MLATLHEAANYSQARLTRTKGRSSFSRVSFATMHHVATAVALFEHEQEAAHSLLAAIILMQALSCLVADFACLDLVDMLESARARKASQCKRVHLQQSITASLLSKRPNRVSHFLTDASYLAQSYQALTGSTQTHRSNIGP